MKIIPRFLSLWRNYTFVMAVFLILAAIVLTFFLQHRYFINDFGRAWEFFTGRPLVFLYNAFLMLIMLAFLTGFTRRPALSVGIMLSLLIVISFLHVNKFDARGYPLLPEDFLLASEAASLAKFINFGAIIATGIAIIITLAGSILLNWFISRRFDLRKQRKSGRWWQRFAIIPRVVIILATALIFMFATDFVRNHGGQKYEDIPWLNSHFVAWNQVRNYDNNGFILGFLFNLQKFQLTAPDDYSESAIQDIRTKYDQIAKDQNALRANLAEQNINFLIVLNESFIDPATIENYYPTTGGDITPNLRKLRQKTPSGLMYSLDYGGGTANIEFEAFTGLTNYWSGTVPYTDLIPQVAQIPSVASFLRSAGFSTTAIHPFNGSMYKRDIVFKAMDIERFITEREMQFRDTEGTSEYINDRSAYLELLDVLKQDPKTPQFIATITMQNHLPFLLSIFGEDAEYPFRLIGPIPEDEDRRDEVAVYFNLLHASDTALGELITALDDSGQPTVLLFFGDHFPGLFHELNDAEDQDTFRLSRETPYFVYANFDSGLKQTTLPTTTPNCLVNTTLNLLNAQKPALFYLLDEVCEEVPILTDLYLRGEPLPDHPALRAYELINYDLLGGQQYWLN